MEFLFTQAKDAEHRKSIIRWLLDRVYLWHEEEGWDEEKVENTYPFSEYPSITVSGKEIAGTFANRMKAVSLMEFYEKILEKEAQQ